MLTVPEAARRAGRTPETVRRWIRSGRLRAERVGTQHVIDEQDLARLVEEPWPVEIPPELRAGPRGEAQPDWVAIIRAQRDAH